MSGLTRNIYKALKDPGYAWRVLSKRLGSLISYCFLGGKSSWPETISLFLTYNCNLACSMCGYWGRCGSLKDKRELAKENLSINDLKRVIDQVTFFGPNITLFGGEPFIYPDWPELIKYIKNKGLRCNVVTNATLLLGREKEIIDSGLDEVIFSLEGPFEIHDKITNVLGSFNKAFVAIGKIARLKKEKKSNLPKINIATTICEDNFRFLYETFELARQLEPDSITFHHLSFVDKDTISKTNEILKDNFGLRTWDWKGFLRSKPPEIDLKVLIEQIKRIRADVHGSGVFFYPDFSEKEILSYYTDFNFKSEEFINRCLSPWMTVYIFPDGRVGPCEELNLYFGNIRNENFKDIWNNEQFLKFRKVLKERKIFPVCTRCTELYRF